MDRQTVGLEERIREMARREALGHAAILAGEGDLSAAARFMAMAMECTGGNPPCGVCGPCRKTAADIHPDVVTVRDEAHKNLSLEVIRTIRSDAFITPNEGRRKVYIFPDCGLLEPRAQDVLLKVLEEGPPQAAFLFCARSAGQLLPTIRSRCALWRVEGESAPAAADPRGMELLDLLAREDRPGVVGFFARLEQAKCRREELQDLLTQARDGLAAALTALYTGGEAGPLARLGAARLMALADLLGRFQRQMRFNLGVGHVCGALAVVLTDCFR